MRLAFQAVKRRNVLLLLAAVALVGVHIGIFESTFNNYLDAVHHLDASSRGSSSFLASCPGFLVALLSGLLFLLPDSSAAAVAMAAWLPASWAWAISRTPLANGRLVDAVERGPPPFHASRAVPGGLLADKGQMGQRLGQVATASTVAYHRRRRHRLGRRRLL